MEEKQLQLARIAALTISGWDFGKTSLYDEEGVEGWEWTGPEGEECGATGCWHELPVMPEELECIADQIIIKWSE